MADVGTKKGEKVDYAILNNESPRMLIECKAIGAAWTPKTLPNFIVTSRLPSPNWPHSPMGLTTAFTLISTEPT